MVSRAPARYRGTFWNCNCACGNAVVVDGQHLKSGATVSCGCYNKEVCTVHGEFSGSGTTQSPEYSAWMNMLERCRNPAHPHFHHYGGRGISLSGRRNLVFLWEQSTNVFASLCRLREY